MLLANNKKKENNKLIELKHNKDFNNEELQT